MCECKGCRRLAQFQGGDHSIIPAWQNVHEFTADCNKEHLQCTDKHYGSSPEQRRHYELMEALKSIQEALNKLVRELTVNG